jgi:multiple sugar transport system permease protein
MRLFRRKGGIHSGREQMVAWGMAAPALLALLVFVVAPLLLGSYWSLTNKRLISPLPTQFIGLDNYTTLFGLDLVSQSPERDAATTEVVIDENGAVVYPPLRAILRGGPRFKGYQEWFHVDIGGQRHVVVARDPTFMHALVNTAVFVLVIVPLQGGLALLLALLVHQRIRGVRAYRSIYFAPVVTSMAVMAVLWTFLYNPGAGLVNRFVETITFGLSKGVPWLQDPSTSLLAIIILSVWQAVGFQMVIFLAGLQGISEELYDAAKVDGANKWARFWNVTRPGLRNTFVFVIVMTTILAFRLFTQVDVMTKGGPRDSTVTLVFEAVQAGFREQRIGYASAIVVAFFLIVLVIALVQRVLLRTEHAVSDS